VAGQSVRVLDKQPKVKAHGTPVAFLHSKDLAGVLVELEQVPQSPSEYLVTACSICILACDNPLPQCHLILVLHFTAWPFPGSRAISAAARSCSTHARVLRLRRCIHLHSAHPGDILLTFRIALSVILLT
jgi:hypothetical protein